MEFLKHFLAVSILVCVIGSMSIAALDAIDRSIFPGCKVLAQRGETLLIRLDSELITGTDSACEKAERLVKKINRSGYDVVIVVSSPDTWVPAVAPVAVMED